MGQAESRPNTTGSKAKKIAGKTGSMSFDLITKVLSSIAVEAAKSCVPM